MYTKLFVVLAVAAVALGVEYPEGVDPISCPNYPFCTGPIARFTAEGQPIPEWVYNPSILPVAPQDPAHDAAVAAAAAAAVAAAAAAAPQPAVTPAPMPAAPRYPAEFDPALCPNYPYCW